MPNVGDPYFRGGVCVGTWEFIGGKLVGVVDQQVSEHFTTEHKVISVTEAHPKPIHHGPLVRPRNQPHKEGEEWCGDCTCYHFPGHHRYR